MIKKLTLRNFRCFKHHEITFLPFTIAVGCNNAGKSTLVEALRLVSIITSRIHGLNFYDVPEWLELPRSFRGVRPSLEGLQINKANIPYGYGEPPSEIEVEFTSGERIHLYIGSELSLHAVIYDNQNRIINSRAQTRGIIFPKVAILPQIGPLIREEKVLTETYVKGSMSSTLSSLHFRNQLKYFYKEFFNDFKELAESSWRHLQIRELEGRNSPPNDQNTVSLLVRDGNFVAEIGWMGHGLQMWLQIMWFLTYSIKADTVILDEPDVYMHADLQRKLARLLKDRFNQTVIATHSVEIMSEVNPENILIVDRNKNRSAYATSLPDVQSTIENFGGVHNIHLARLWNSRRLILVEGDDMALLKKIQSLLFPTSEVPFDSVPQISIGGWSGWPYVIGSSMLLQNSGGERILVYCIFDSDYHISTEKDVRRAQASERSIQLHIWNRKEIENYLLIPETILRLINMAQNSATLIEITTQLSLICDTMKDDTMDAFANEYLLADRSRGLQNANRLAREYVNSRWNTLEDKISLVSGKTLISKLSDWSQATYGVSFGVRTILNQIRPAEIPDEMRLLITSIEYNNRLT